MPALRDILYSGFIAEGQPVYDFEATFGARFGHETVLAVSSGTGALHIAMLLAGAAPGREVITTAMTAEPTNMAILHTGATPVFADVDPKTGNLDPASVAERITDRTCAICVVHYAGYPADLTALRRLADHHGIDLIEDCAHALGATFAGRPIGAFGDSAIFSFQAIKHLTTVDGGALVLRDPVRADRARRLRWFGLTKGMPRHEINVGEAGFKYNMSNVSATIGLRQIDFIDARIDRHVANGRFFDEALAATPGLKPAWVLDGASPTYWLYTLLCDNSDEVAARLRTLNVEASKLHRPNHLHDLFRPYGSDMPGLEEFYRRLLHLPCGWWVDDATREQMADALTRG